MKAHSVLHLVLLARLDMLEINRQFQVGLPAKGAEGMEIWNRGSKALAATVLTGLGAIQVITWYPLFPAGHLVTVASPVPNQWGQMTEDAEMTTGWHLNRGSHSIKPSTPFFLQIRKLKPGRKKPALLLPHQTARQGGLAFFPPLVSCARMCILVYICGHTCVHITWRAKADVGNHLLSHLVR